MGLGLEPWRCAGDILHMYKSSVAFRGGDSTYTPEMPQVSLPVEETAPQSQASPPILQAVPAQGAALNLLFYFRGGDRKGE